MLRLSMAYIVLKVRFVLTRVRQARGEGERPARSDALVSRGPNSKRYSGAVL